MTASRIALIGAKGNMGSRYKAIMNHLNISYLEYDLDNIDSLENDINDIKSFIIATPTDTHFSIIMDIKKYDKYILCEKPISKNKNEIDILVNSSVKLKMVNQYEYMIDFETKKIGEDSYYSYFKSGGDGIIWDCINIIGLSNNYPRLSNKSPYWDCQLNGFRLNIHQMDFAYMEMIKFWDIRPTSDLLYIKKSHEKIFNRLSI